MDMTLPALQSYDYDRRSLFEEQLERASECIQGRMLAAVEEYLAHEGIDDLRQVTENTICNYREYIFASNLTTAQKRAYASALETSIIFGCRNDFSDLIKEVMDVGVNERARRNKVLHFLMVKNVTSLQELSYPLRESFRDYLIKAKVNPNDIRDFLKVFDRFKLYAIEKICKTSFYSSHTIIYKPESFYLAYHPDVRLAKEFYYTHDKEELIFDFSLPASEKLKKQVFSMLKNILETYSTEENTGRKNRRELQLLPLRKLYLYCVENEIEDLETLEMEQIQGFKNSMDGNVGTKLDIYMQIVYNVQKYLFVSSPDIHWYANVWFVERFALKDDRNDPSDPVVSIKFYTIKDRANRELLKEYVKYSIGIGHGAMSMIRTRYYEACRFLTYCDTNNIKVTKVTAVDVEKYFNEREEQNILADTYNADVAGLYSFYRFLKQKKIVEAIPFHMEYYLKKVIPRHNERCVPKETQAKMLFHLKYLPMDMKLMFLHLWSCGLRINEVCTMKAGNYYLKNNAAWIQVYQRKMKTEKMVPIPRMLYDLTMNYITENNIGANEWVFKRKNGQAYSKSTFVMKIKEFCLEHNISCGDYLFRSHDYRHTVATDLYNAKTPLQGIREYLGHRTQEMTKQYIDEIQQKIDASSQNFFDTETGLKNAIRKRRGDTVG